MLRTFKTILIVIVIALAAGVVVVRGIHSRVNAAAIIRERTDELAIPSVSVIHPKIGNPKDEIALPGNIEAFVDAPVYARTSGYLKKWYSDIGTRVRAGDLLADIESPEVDQQLSQARADLATAQANMKLAEITMNRDLVLIKTDAIAHQDVDNAVGAFDADKAAVASQTANVKRLEQLVAFEKVYAPFDGIVTARNTDIGQLVNAGNGGSGQQLFRVSSVDKLRIFVSVPQVYSRAAVEGVNADITLIEAPGRHFAGHIVRNTGAIDPATRTLLTEVDVDNSSHQLMPGAYAEIHLRLGAATRALVVPVTSMIFRSEGLQVAVVRGDTVEMVPVTEGRDFGTEVEITSGITSNDLIVINTPDSLTAGTKVHAEFAGQRP